MMHFLPLLATLSITALSLAAPSNGNSNTTYPNITLPSLLQIPKRNTTHVRSSQLPVGAILTHCTVPDTIALTFDDGPFIYTAQILDILAQHDARVTFFLNGRNRGYIYDFSDLVRRAWAEGHQLGSHTWNHPSLVALPYAEIVRQMTDLEDAFMRIVGFFPTYMRPPFLFHDPVVLGAMADLGYHVIGASIDTKDYEHDDPGSNWVSFEKFVREVDAGGTIVLAHDSHEHTVEILVENMLVEVEGRGLRIVPVGECLGDPSEFWYRSER